MSPVDFILESMIDSLRRHVNEPSVLNFKLGNGCVNLRLTLLLLTMLAFTAKLSAPIKCDPLPVLQVDERAIHGSASIDGKPLAFADVRLYSAHKLVRHTTTDAQGGFLLENPPLGRYRLRFKGLGTFDIEVIPPHSMQEGYYSFSRYHGCLDWGFSSD